MMNEDKMLDRIRKSAEDLETPDSLKPDQIQKMLEAEGANPHTNQDASPHFFGRKKWYRWGSVVAAALVLVAAIWGVNTFTVQNTETAAVTSESSISNNDTGDTSEAYVASSSVGAGDSADIPDTDTHKVSSASSYKAIYEKIKEQENAGGEESYIMYDFVEENVAESATEDTATSDASASATHAMPVKDSEENYSQTNLRTEGVDEGDIVKTDGTYIYVLSSNQGVHVIQADSLKEIALIPFPSYNETIREMYLDGDVFQMVADGTTSTLKGSGSEQNAYNLETEEQTTVYTYDVSDPENITLTGQVSQSGSYQSSRKNGSFLYLFTYYYPKTSDNDSQLERYIPKAAGSLLPEDDIYLPVSGNYSSYLVMSSIDSSTPSKVQDSKSVLSGAELFYVSGDYIFVTSTSWNNGIQTTDIISFRYVKGKITAQAGNTIKGYLNNSFSLDEYHGYLRVVSTYWDNQKNYDINNLFIMDKDLKTVGSLVDIAPDETIQSARFMGDTCYFVTFRQTDPLFSVDLSDPKNPKMLGELKITGFSEYLHPYGDNLLLGIGWEVDPDTQENLGLKLSMFDISDPANVVEKDKMVIKNVYNSPAMDNYKAVMIDPEKNLFGFAYQTRLDDNYERSASSYSLFSYDRKNGFTSTFTTSLNQTEGNSDYYSDYYSDLENIRGLYIKNTFYLATLEDIQSYNMNEDYAQTGKVTW